MVFAEYEWEYDWKFSGLPAKVAFNVAGTGFSYRRVIQKCWNFQTRPRKVMQIYGTPVMSPRTTLMSTLDVYLHLGKVTINQWIVIWFTLFLGFHRDISSFAIERLQLRRQTPRPGTHVRHTWKDAMIGS